MRGVPLLSAPQQSQVRIVDLFPVELSRRLPQSVQKTREFMADMVVFGVCERIEGKGWRRDEAV